MRGRPASIFLLVFFGSVLSSPFASARNLGILNQENAETIQKLVLDLQSQSRDDQVRAAQALGEMGSDAQGAVPALVKVIKTGSPEARVVSTIALLKIDPTMRDMIPILLRALEKEGKEQEVALEQEIGLQEDALRKWSTLMKSKVDPKILPVLVQALRESDSDIRTLGVLVLGSLARELPEALPYVLKAYRDPDKQVRGAVLGALSRIGPGPKEVIPAILKGFKDSEPEVRARAVIALGRLGASSKEVVPALTRALNDPEPQVRTAALKILESFGGDAREAAPTVAARAGQGSPGERLAAAAAAIKIDPSQAGRMVPLLIVFLKDPALAVPVRLQAADLLEETGVAGKEVVSLTELFSDSSPEIRARTIRMLARAGPEVVPAISRSMRNANPLVRTGALQALCGMRPMPPELIPALAGSLKDKERSIRYLAAEGLGDRGVLAQKAIPDLIRALGDPEESVRSSAGNSLLKMGKPAVAALRQAASDPKDPQLQARASILIKKAGYDESP
ncbi:MAG: HEAT repeat domain-containing protein [Candidatus Omnitrophota bacterium]|nr:HEAT repeat domain-containing protein [Candidatus Omnitrophota bacterium]